ncbi:Cro/CI family transcriptional regulator [Psychrobacter sanguinis]|uniref:Cro/CI family transcriptional regulator n=1 Tax=Psychrobacter sanguinis TaxID=861445 RepID=UPI00020C7E99|nr:Cro/CI family transcriptional regulator [Psychrobacter sanguinis]EGK11525.1 hypothetical protein HMPREF9373_1732 [Psychrobacter sp. 1501(2011)]MDY3307603.1 Cro/CI family transcriptional regulator [Psychrobacter sanguinis]
MAMSKEEALSYANGSVNKLAELLGISHAAVSQWEEDQIPELREYQLKALKPEHKFKQQTEET